MSEKRQQNQNQLAFWFAGAGEACFDGQEGTATPVAERETESPAGSWQLMAIHQRLVEGLTDSNRRIRNRTYGGVGGADGRLSPLSRSTKNDGLPHGSLWQTDGWADKKGTG
jgi:hypothetical protein